MYTFFDRGDRSITLRPEGTAGVVRSLIERSQTGGVQRLWYTGQCFATNVRQGGSSNFHQLGVEVLGSADPERMRR